MNQNTTNVSVHKELTNIIFQPKSAGLSQLDKIINCLYILKYLKQIQEIIVTPNTYLVDKLFKKVTKLTVKNDENITKRYVFPKPFEISSENIENAINYFNDKYLELTSEEISHKTASSEIEQIAIQRIDSPTKPMDIPNASLIKEKIDWKTNYNSLLQKIKNRGVSPLVEDNPNVMRDIVTSFINIFEQTPDNKKKWLLSQPLYTQDENPSWTLPLNYIMFTGDFNSLTIVEPFLQRENWLAKGPYNSTFIHCILSGIEKNCSRRGDPFKCVQKLLSIAPSLRTTTNQFGTMPYQYLIQVERKLHHNLKHSQMYDGGKYAGLGKISSVGDFSGGFYNESDSDYEFFNQIHNIKELLISNF